jgi:23S rRNA pseudouridine955/2504/2580 synthase
MEKKSVTRQKVGPEEAGGRIDNYLARILKGVPKSHLYRILRSGEVRVNSGRVDATYRVMEGDEIRIPPIRTASPNPARHRPLAGLNQAILFEDDAFLALNKPAGMAVHGGSGVASGVIESLRAARPEARFLELVHRLDRDTSGVLLIAKKRSALRRLHEELRAGKMDKRYLVLVAGAPSWKSYEANESLQRTLNKEGERRVRVSEEGQVARTRFTRKQVFAQTSLLEAKIYTGRTHQIRVHLAHLGYPVAYDEKYGDFAWNRDLAKAGLKRMFLHAAQLKFRHPENEEIMTVVAPLPQDLQDFLNRQDGPGGPQARKE